MPISEPWRGKLGLLVIAAPMFLISTPDLAVEYRRPG